MSARAGCRFLDSSAPDLDRGEGQRHVWPWVALNIRGIGAGILTSVSGSLILLMARWMLFECHANDTKSPRTKISRFSPPSSSAWRRNISPYLCPNALSESWRNFYSLGLVSGGLRKRAASFFTRSRQG